MSESLNEKAVHSFGPACVSVVITCGIVALYGLNNLRPNRIPHYFIWPYGFSPVCIGFLVGVHFSTGGQILCRRLERQRATVCLCGFVDFLFLIKGNLLCGFPFAVCLIYALSGNAQRFTPLPGYNADGSREEKSREQRPVAYIGAAILCFLFGTLALQAYLVLNWGFLERSSLSKWILNLRENFQFTADSIVAGTRDIRKGTIWVEKFLLLVKKKIDIRNGK